VISITLPSLYPDACAQTLANLAAVTRGPYEAIVVSSFKPDGPNVTWVEEGGQRRGCAMAHHVAAAYATGDHLFPFADDHELVDGWDEIALGEYHQRVGRYSPFALGLRGAHSAHVGTNWGIYYPYFPLMLREDVRRVGWIGPDYRAGFGDSDLAMRIWAAGGRCEWSSAGMLRPTAADKRKDALYAPEDLALFCDRWSARYGWSRTDARWSIDQFNVDLRPEENPELCVGSTIFHNEPSFLTRVRRMTC